jgi:ribonuclease HI
LPVKYEAWVDGSFIAGKTGYGSVILADGVVVAELSGCVAGAHAHRQVAGELEAVLKTLEWCAANGVTRILIHYDYAGVAAWPQGLWKANLPLTRNYRAAVAASGISVDWKKVKAHSGIALNERADALARQGAGGASGSGDDPSSRLQKLSDFFSAFLETKGYAIEVQEMSGFHRLVIGADDGKLGLADLYAKKSGECKIDLRGFRDDAVREGVQRLWDEFVATGMM